MIYKNEIGKRITINVGQDISTATSVGMVFIKPDDTTLTVTATIGTTSLTTDCDIIPANEWIYYDFVSGNLDQSGTWRIKSKVIIGSQTLYGPFDKFKVLE